MKRIVSVILAFLFVFALCSCGKPEETSDAMYQIGINALSVADDYIGGKIMNDETKERLHEFMEQADKQYEAECKEVGSDTLIGTEYSNDAIIQLSISSLYFSVSSAGYGSTPMSEIIDRRDSLAKYLGE